MPQQLKNPDLPFQGYTKTGTLAVNTAITNLTMFGVQELRAKKTMDICGETLANGMIFQIMVGPASLNTEICQETTR
jgi:hypothetical protein